MADPPARAVTPDLNVLPALSSHPDDHCTRLARLTTGSGLHRRFRLAFNAVNSPSTPERALVAYLAAQMALVSAIDRLWPACCARLLQRTPGQEQAL